MPPKLNKDQIEDETRQIIALLLFEGVIPLDGSLIELAARRIRDLKNGVISFDADRLAMGEYPPYRAPKQDESARRAE